MQKTERQDSLSAVNGRFFFHNSDDMFYMEFSKTYMLYRWGNLMLLSSVL